MTEFLIKFVLRTLRKSCYRLTLTTRRSIAYRTGRRDLLKELHKGEGRHVANDASAHNVSSALDRVNVEGRLCWRMFTGHIDLQEEASTDTRSVFKAEGERGGSATGFTLLVADMQRRT